MHATIAPLRRLFLASLVTACGDAGPTGAADASDASTSTGESTGMSAAGSSEDAATLPEGSESATTEVATTEGDDDESLAAGGDIDGDGREDFLVVADDPTSPGPTGRLPTFVVYGRAGTAPIDLADVEANAGGHALDSDQSSTHRMRVTGLGDFDGDGLDDIAIASPFDQVGFESLGRVYVMFGVRTNPAEQ